MVFPDHPLRYWAGAPLSDAAHLEVVARRAHVNDGFYPALSPGQPVPCINTASRPD